ncbi:MAG: M23 family metallopeptidase [Alphaproteobacteria bacterium]|nr:M23 family metallopeptidase [Alphaproteobacteria bacterium]MBV9373927.1 M23 family metallopeptidase [Alphaproteobacteria bacterium]
MVAETPSRGSACCPENSTRFLLAKLSLPICLKRMPAAAISAVVVIAVAACYFGLGGERAAANTEASIDQAELSDAEVRDGTAPSDPLPADARDRSLTRTAGFEQNCAPLDVEHRRKPSALRRLAGLIETDFAEPDAALSQPEALKSDGPPEPEPQSRNLAELTRQAVAEAKRLLASTGLNVDRLFPQLGHDHGGRGGPFVAPPKGSRPDEESPAKMEELRSLMRSLPLLVPLDYYQLESRFGPRRDPFNHRLAFHTGIDLSAPYMSPVHATAAGTVSFAGYRSDYGKVVEIDHGNGIATVYGHLHRFIVSVGQRVAERELIGLLGSSGRSSGPHVHYEILVNYEPQDPEKFIGLARLIPAAETPGMPDQ